MWPASRFVVAFANVIAVATVRRFMIESKVRMRRPHYDFTLTMAAIVGLCGLTEFALLQMTARDGTAPGRGAPGQRAAGRKIQPRSSRRKCLHNLPA